MVPGTLSKLVCCNLNITNHLCFQLERKINLLCCWGTVVPSPVPVVLLHPPRSVVLACWCFLLGEWFIASATVSGEFASYVCAEGFQAGQRKVSLYTSAPSLP